MTVQTLLIPDWHPTMNPNGSHGHWRTHQHKHDVDRDMAWASAMQAGWHFVPGRVRLTITLVYSLQRRRDIDNLYAKCKGLVDGLKEQRRNIPDGTGLLWTVWHKGWFADDSTECLELVVHAAVSREWAGTRIELEAI